MAIIERSNILHAEGPDATARATKDLVMGLTEMFQRAPQLIDEEAKGDTARAAD